MASAGFVKHPSW